MVIDNLLMSIGPRIKAAQRVVVETTTRCFMAEGKALDKVAADRQITTNRLLSELLAFEGVEFIPKPPERSNRPIHTGGDGMTGSPAPEIILVPIPKTEHIRRQADYYRVCGDCVLNDRPLPTSILDGKPPFARPKWYANGKMNIDSVSQG